MSSRCSNFPWSPVPKRGASLCPQPPAERAPPPGSGRSPGHVLVAGRGQAGLEGSVMCDSEVPALSLLPGLPAVGSPRALGLCTPQGETVRLSTQLPYLPAVESARRTAQRLSFYCALLGSHNCRLSLPENRDRLLVGTKHFVSYFSYFGRKFWYPVSPRLSLPALRCCCLDLCREVCRAEMERRPLLGGQHLPPGSGGFAATGPTTARVPFG